MKYLSEHVEIMTQIEALVDSLNENDTLTSDEIFDLREDLVDFIQNRSNLKDVIFRSY